MTEVWKPIPGFEFYEASDAGRVRSLRRPPPEGSKAYRKVYGGVVLTGHINRHNGYEYVCLCVNGKAISRRVHVLVLAAHRGLRPDGMQGRHLDGSRVNNRLENLAYGTPKENDDDKDRHGTRLRGLRNPNGKLSEDQKRAICAAYPAITQTALAEQYGVSQAAIWYVLRVSGKPTEKIA